MKKNSIYFITASALLMAVLLYSKLYNLPKDSSPTSSKSLDAKLPSISDQDTNAVEIKPEMDESGPLEFSADIGFARKRIQHARENLKGAKLNSRLLGIGLQFIQGAALKDARELLKEYVGDVNYNDLAMELSSRYAAEDPDFGIDWIRSLKGAETTDGLLHAFAYSMRPTDAFDFLARHRADMTAEESNKIESAAWGNLSKTEPFSTVMNGVMESTTLDLQGYRDALSSMLFQAAAKEPISKVMDAYPQLSAKIGEDKMIDYIASSWSQRNPNDLAQWMESHMDAPLAQSGVEKFMKRWARDDAESASKWLAGLPPSETRNTGIAALVSKITETNPEEAVIWSRELGDDPRRTHLENEALRRLSVTDRAAYERLAKTAGSGR